MSWIAGALRAALGTSGTGATTGKDHDSLLGGGAAAKGNAAPRAVPPPADDHTAVCADGAPQPMASLAAAARGGMPADSTSASLPATSTSAGGGDVGGGGAGAGGGGGGGGGGGEGGVGFSYDEPPVSLAYLKSKRARRELSKLTDYLPVSRGKDKKA